MRLSFHHQTMEYRQERKTDMSGTNRSTEFVRSLVERLIENGLDPQSIPAFVRFLVRMLIDNPSLRTEKINDGVRSNGVWELEINDEILQLTWACLTEISRWVPDHLVGESPGLSHVMS